MGLISISKKIAFAISFTYIFKMFLSRNSSAVSYGLVYEVIN